MTEVKMVRKASTLASLVYERDNDGQVTKTTSKGLPGTETNESSYDENNRLTEAAKQAYEYDKANDPTKIEGKAGYKYNEADELTEGPETSKYAYNEDGQRTKLEPKTGEATTYTYDQNGNLTAVKQGTSIEDSYTYNGNNLRQTQTIKGTKTNLTWDTAEPLPILLLDETNSYIYGPENIPIEQISEGGTVSYLHHDQQGSIRLLTNTKGENVGAYTYTAYGTVQEHTGTTTTALGYDGQYTSTDTGLIYLRARTYDPQTVQFLNIDPALEDAGEPYVYVKDDPLNDADTTGLCQDKEKECAFLALAIRTWNRAAGESWKEAERLRKIADDILMDPEFFLARRFLPSEMGVQAFVLILGWRADSEEAEARSREERAGELEKRAVALDCPGLGGGGDFGGDGGGGDF